MTTNPIVFAFSAVFAFAWREAVRSTAAWRAFHGRTMRDFFLKFLGFALPVLVCLPAVCYVVVRKLMSQIRLTVGDEAFAMSLAITASLVVLAGLSPRAAKNLWVLGARYQSLRAEEKHTDTWLWHTPGTERVPPLPHPLYSLQVILVLGLLPLGVAYWEGSRLARSEATFSMTPEWSDYCDLLLALYTAQMVVLFQMAKVRGFVYRDPSPKWLFNKRLLLTFFILVLLPVAFGVGWYGWLTGLAPSWALGLVALFLAAFPYCCSSALFLIARRARWTDDPGSPEIAGGMADWYFEIMSALGLVSLAVLICFYTQRSEVLDAMMKANQSWLQYTSPR